MYKSYYCILHQSLVSGAHRFSLAKNKLPLQDEKTIYMDLTDAHFLCLPRRNREEGLSKALSLRPHGRSFNCYYGERFENSKKYLISKD